MSVVPFVISEPGVLFFSSFSTDVTASATILTEQHRPQRIPFVLHGHDYVANALQDHNCSVHVGETIETAVIVAKGEVCVCWFVRLV